MRFAVRITEPARLDGVEAAEWDEHQEAGLGERFGQAVVAAARRLGDEALLHPVRFHDVRRAGLPRFPSYGLFYLVREETVTVFAIIHGARNPAWVRRRRSHLD